MMLYESQSDPRARPSLDVDEMIMDCAQRTHDLIRQFMRNPLSKSDCQKLVRSLNAEAALVSVRKAKSAPP